MSNELGKSQCPHAHETFRGRPRSADLVKFAPLDRDFIADPYPAYAHLREQDPVHQLASGYWVITRYDDVLTALKHTGLSNAPPSFSILSADKRSQNPCAEIANNIFHLQDAAGHARGRRVVGKAYFQQLKSNPPDLDQIASDLLESLREQGEFDVVDDFSNSFTVSVICKLLGIPDPDLKYLKELSRNFFYLFNMKTATMRSKPVERGLLKFRDLLFALLEERKRCPENDLISALCHMSNSDEQLSDEEIVDTCMFMFADGVENVNGGIGSGLLALIRHPDQLQEVKEKPELLGGAVEECLRYDAPAQFIIREAHEEITLGGHVIEPGGILMLVIGSANRDERQFDRADHFDIHRAYNPHLSFGRGRHICLGTNLAKSEIEAALRALLKHVGPEHCQFENLGWSLSVGHRWPVGLKVNLSV